MRVARLASRKRQTDRDRQTGGRKEGKTDGYGKSETDRDAETDSRAASETDIDGKTDRRTDSQTDGERGKERVRQIDMGQPIREVDSREVGQSEGKTDR